MGQEGKLLLVLNKVHHCLPVPHLDPDKHLPQRLQGSEQEQDELQEAASSPSSQASHFCLSQVVSTVCLVWVEEPLVSVEQQDWASAPDKCSPPLVSVGLSQLDAHREVLHTCHLPHRQTHPVATRSLHCYLSF